MWVRCTTENELLVYVRVIRTGTSFGSCVNHFTGSCMCYVVMLLCDGGRGSSQKVRPHPDVGLTFVSRIRSISLCGRSPH